jgi:hypothetical protein
VASGPNYISLMRCCLESMITGASVSPDSLINGPLGAAPSVIVG